MVPVGGNCRLIAQIAIALSYICGGFFFAQRAHLARSVALQLKHIHGVVDPPTVVIKLDVPRQALDTHLDLATIGISGTPRRQNSF